MNIIYRHTLTIGTQTYTVHPVYKDDMALDYQHESQQLFYRANLSGKMDFVGEDASRIIGAPFTTEYILTIESSADMGLTWQVFHVSKFYQTDCTINLDDLKVTVKPAVKDRYQKVLDGLEKEYNLIELKPIIEPIEMAKRGIIQIYGIGDTKVSNFSGGMYWEQDFDLSDKDKNELWERYHFSKSYDTIEMIFENPPYGLGGRFEGKRNDDGSFVLYNNQIIYRIVGVPLDNHIWMDVYIERIIGGQIEWEAESESIYDISRLVFEKTDHSENDLVANSTETMIFGRWLCDVPTAILNGEVKNPQPLATDDPSYGGNLHYALGYIVTNITRSDRTSTEPTQWGRKNQQEYFNTPNDNAAFMPVFRSQWVNYSYWYVYSTYDFYVERQLRKYYYLKDAYPLWSVIQVLLDKLETGVTIEPTAACSEFFYGTNNPLDRNLTAKPYITPKSNITAGEYSQPAMKAPITLEMLLNMLKKAFNCYWYIDEDMKMHIEHLSWFKNGGSYNGVHQVGIDLTMLEQPTNLKRWSFGKNNYQFDKNQMPARYQYKWMDDCTEYFLGNSIDIESPFVQTDKIEEINVSNFSSDVDYMIASPDNVSKDGFALLMPVSDSTGLHLPIEYRGTSYDIRYIQNLYASMTYLQPNFLVSDLPAWKYNWGNAKNQPSKGIIRGKKQTVLIPVGDTIPDIMKLIRTGLGDGQVEKMSINLASRMASTTLKFDSYDAE